MMLSCRVARVFSFFVSYQNLTSLVLAFMVFCFSFSYSLAGDYTANISLVGCFALMPRGNSTLLMISLFGVLSLMRLLFLI